MKNSTKIYILIGVAIIVALIIMSNNKQAVKQSDTVTGQEVSGTTSKAPAVTPTTKTPAKTTTQVKPSGPAGSYNDYQNSIIQLSANQSKCKDLSANQYKLLYQSKLTSSTFENSYNAKTGQCYFRVDGAIQSPYSSTSTTGVIYFRNATKNTLLAECTDVNGVTFADNEWKCTDKITGKTIVMGEFRNIIYKATVN